MSFYTSLFVASLIVALLILWLGNAFLEVGRGVYKAFLPSSKEKLAKQIDAQLRPTINDTPMPWGRKDHETPARVARAQTAAKAEATPWGWPGNQKNDEIREQQPDYSLAGNSSLGSRNLSSQSDEKPRPRVGWPYRDEEITFAGNTYKVQRKAKVKKANLGKSGKPWGW